MRRPLNPPIFDEAKWNDLAEQVERNWQIFQRLVDDLAVSQEIKNTLRSHAGRTVSLLDEALRSAVDTYSKMIEWFKKFAEEYVKWMQPRITSMQQKVLNQGKGRRKQHDETAQRNEIIRQKLDQGLDPESVFDFLKEHHLPLVKRVRSAENMMKVFKKASRHLPE
jgi:hypothetical protein